MLRFDFVDMSRAVITPEGWIRDKPTLTRSGIFEYRRQDGGIRREYRPPDEVFSEDHLSSLRGVPVTDGHPGRVHAGDEKTTKAIVGAVLTEGERKDSDLLADVVIYDTNRIGKRRELSLGYSIELDETPGEIDGQKYDAIQRKLKVNHLAVVHRGRAGNAKLRLDREDAVEASVIIEDEDIIMPDPTAPKLISVRVNRLDYQAQPEVAAELERLDAAVTAEKQRADIAIAAEKQAREDAVKAEKSRADALEAERDSLKAAVAAHADALKKAREDAIAEVSQRVELEGVAKSHGVEVKGDMTPRAIREAVVNKLVPNVFKFDGKPDTYVEVAFDIETAKADQARQQSGNNRAIINGVHPAPVAPARQDSAAAPIRSSAALRAAIGRA